MVFIVYFIMPVKIIKIRNDYRNNFVSKILRKGINMVQDKKFNGGDVVTIITNHYNNDSCDFYKEYDFARIVDIKGNFYILDLQADYIEDKCCNVMVDVNTLQLSKDIHRGYSEYLDANDLHDYIDNIMVYQEVFKKEILECKERVITNSLNDIFKGYIRNREAKTLLDISNAKDEIFVMFSKLYSKQEDLDNLRRLDYQIRQINYHHLFYQEHIIRHYEWALRCCTKLDKKNKYNNFNICE